MKVNANRMSVYYQNTGEVQYDQFFPRKSKHIMDELDKIISVLYGITKNELDFIINYNVKYRMGNVLFGEDDEEAEDE